MKAGVFLFVLLLAGLVGRPAAGQSVPLPDGSAGPVVLRDTTKIYNLGCHWSILTDLRPEARQHPLTLAQVQAPPYAAQFVPSTELVPNRETLPGDYWLRCRVENQARTATWLFEASMPNSKPFEFFIITDQGRIIRHWVNEEENWNATHQYSGQAHTISLPLPHGRPYTLFVHSRNDIFWFSIIERLHYVQMNIAADVEAAAYFGIMLGLLVYNILLFFSVRDRSYFYYVLFTLFFTLLQADMMGYLTQYWLHEYSTLVKEAVQQILLALTMLASVQTARSFLETRRLLPRYDVVLRASLLLAVFPVLSVWVDGPLLHYGPQLAPLLLCVLLLAAGLWQLVAGYRPARYFMAGWMILMVAIVDYYLRTLGLVPLSIYTEYGVRAASALEVILLSLGLADRINLTRQERQVAQREAFLALQEKEEVQQRANEALSQRAAELQKAYAELQASLQVTGRLQELDELKTRFFTNISHELRTPLTLILGPLDELMAGPITPALLTERHTLMHRHAGRLLELINQLLDIARLEAGQLQLRAVRTDLRAFVQHTVAAFDSLAAVRGLSLRAVLPSAELLVDFDPDQLEKVLTNLLGNALKFTPEGGKIQVTLRADSDAGIITVADTGPGIPTAHQPLIFDRFHQVDSSTSRRHDGSGIGLALVKELVDLHHGTVNVESIEGMGTMFTVRLPLVNEELRMRNEELPVAKSSVSVTDSSFLIPHSSFSDSDTRPLILVVDDHADMREYVANCLRAEYRVVTAAEGEAGLAVITETVPELVVSDLMMPVLDGLELCRRLKTDERTSHIPVVLLTARTHGDSRLQGLELGADDYLTKPFRPQELRIRVRNLLQQRELMRYRFAREVTLQPRDIAITSADETFLNRAVAVVEKEMVNAYFDVEQFAEQLNLSRIQLYRKLKALTDQSPTDFVRVLRLRRAAQLLAAQAGSVADIAYQVGFNNLSYFSKCFREQFGHVPSEHSAQTATA